MIGVKVGRAGGHGAKALPNQTEGATGPLHLETSAERDSKISVHAKSPMRSLTGRSAT